MLLEVRSEQKMQLTIYFGVALVHVCISFRLAALSPSFFRLEFLDAKRRTD
jgi:hypothetical protein